MGRVYGVVSHWVCCDNLCSAVYCLQCRSLVERFTYKENSFELVIIYEDWRARPSKRNKAKAIRLTNCSSSVKVATKFIQTDLHNMLIALL